MKKRKTRKQTATAIAMTALIGCGPKISDIQGDLSLSQAVYCDRCELADIHDGRESTRPFSMRTDETRIIDPQTNSQAMEVIFTINSIGVFLEFLDRNYERIPEGVAKAKNGYQRKDGGTVG